METYEREMDSIEWCMCSAADDRTFSVYRCIERRSQHKLQCHVSTYSVGGPVRLLGKVGKLVRFCRARALLSVAPWQVSMRVLWRAGAVAASLYAVYVYDRMSGRG